MNVCAIVGSLRKGSYNRMLAHACQELAPADMTIVIWDRLRELPHYDTDLDTHEPPEAVADLRATIGAADALLIVMPEYNYSIPGVLKNAIDWASRPAFKSCLNKKPAAVLGAATGLMGTVRGQLALRQSLLFTETYLLLKPEVVVMKAAEKFDADGKLTDEPTRKMVASLLEALGPWATRFA